MGVRQTMVSDELLKEFSQEQIEQVDAIIERYQGKPGSLIPVLAEVQGVLGYLPHEIQHRIAEGLNLPQSQVFGVVTFYSFFTMVPRGRHLIKVCLGTACYVRGNKDLVESLSRNLSCEVGGTSEDRRFSLESVRCLGCCGIAPVITVDEQVYREVRLKAVPSILEQYE
ncbi:MAG TPA: NAD(P)H-dependent oxidoreductase subunit E [Thermodesulfobacteriota bacterium]